VVGGLVPLGLVTARAWRGGYTAGFHPGVEYTAMYWHFLDVVWLVLFAVLYLGS
jgi:cytochrome c oxidase subunit 3